MYFKSDFPFRVNVMGKHKQITQDKVNT